MRWLFAFVLLALPVQAEEIILGLSQDEIAITTSFDGSEILVFGAVKRERPIPQGPPLDVIVTVAGPSEPVVVRRKDQRLGIWVNADAVQVDAAPSFYAVAASGALNDILTQSEDLKHRITVPRTLGAIGAPSEIGTAEEYAEALIRIKGRQDLYQVMEDHVSVDEQTLFRASITLPAALTEGAYATRIFLMRDGNVIANYETSIDVRKVGLERLLFSMSREQPFWYGLMSLAIAIFAGWGASAVFSLFRN